MLFGGHGGLWRKVKGIVWRVHEHASAHLLVVPACDHSPMQSHTTRVVVVKDAHAPQRVATAQRRALRQLVPLVVPTRLAVVGVGEEDVLAAVPISHEGDTVCVAMGVQMNLMEGKRAVISEGHRASEHGSYGGRVEVRRDLETARMGWHAEAHILEEDSACAVGSGRRAQVEADADGEVATDEIPTSGGGWQLVVGGEE